MLSAEYLQVFKLLQIKHQRLHVAWLLWLHLHTLQAAQRSCFPPKESIGGPAPPKLKGPRLPGGCGSASCATSGSTAGSELGSGLWLSVDTAEVPQRWLLSLSCDVALLGGAANPPGAGSRVHR